MRMVTVSIGNIMNSVAIWKRTRTSEFFKDLKIARVRRTSAICGLLKTHERVFLPDFTRNHAVTY